MPVVQGAGQIGIPGMQQRNRRGSGPVGGGVLGQTQGQGVVGQSGAYDLGAAIRNPWENYLKPNVVQPVQQGWADFTAGLRGPNPGTVGAAAGALPTVNPAGAELLGAGTAAGAAEAAQAAQAAGAGGAQAAGLGVW
jgi:hypothetical protein